MPAPELVITGAPSKTWPGGIISLRASDWIGDSAGASVEADARAIEGEVIRETSVYTGSLDTLANRTTALTAMDDTLTIDLSLVDFTAVTQESHFLGDGSPFPMTYMPYCSVLVEGDWGTQQFGYSHTPLRFDRACMVGIFGDGFYPDPNGNMQLGTFGFAGGTYLRNCPQYRMQGFGDYVYIETGTEVLHVRAFARDITTIEILIDQIVLVPIWEWGYDYTSIYGGENSVSGIQGTTNFPVDGADGGDDNGKFTWHPRNSVLEPTGGAEEEDTYGGGDYQQDDSEYMVEIVPADEYTSSSIWDDSALPAQHAYSIVGAYHREAEVYETDAFSRTDVFDFASTPKGYLYQHSAGVYAAHAVDGSRGRTHLSGVGDRASEGGLWRLGSTGAPGMFSSDYTFSGKFEAMQPTGIPIWDGVTTEVTVIVGLAGIPGGVGPGFAILFDVINKQWAVVALTDANVASGIYHVEEMISGWFDISSWYSVGTEVAFKIELKRFVLRVKLWEASGSEPGAWDHEDFHPLYVSGTGWVDYPYGEDEMLAARWQQTPGPPSGGGEGIGWDAEVAPFGIAGGNGYIAQWFCYWDDFEFEFDPYGDTANVNALIEHPKGTEVGRIEVPSGAWHFVYWGRKQYAAVVDLGWGDTGALDFAQKVWSDAGAAELQRAELPVTYFLGILGGDIVVMNWRSADRQSSGERVLSG